MARQGRDESAHRVGLLLNPSEFAEELSIALGVLRYIQPYRNWVLQRDRASVETLRFLQQWGVQGVLGRLINDDTLAVVASMDVPAVNVSGRRVVEGLHNVLPDDEMVGRLAADHLASRGCRHYAFLGICNHLWTQLRLDGFLYGLGQRGNAGNCSVADESISRMLAESIWANPARLGDWLAGLPKPLGLFCENDIAAYVAHRACLYRGIDLVQDVYLLGVDNIAAYSQAASPAFSSIELGMIGSRSAECLDNLMRGRRQPHLIRVPPQRVVVRDIGEAGPVLPPQVRAVLDFIASHVGEAIQVADVLDHVPVSRRALEYSFKRATGQTIYQAIQAQRMQRARMLLTTTQWSIEHVAHAAGFHDPAHFSNTFHQHHQTTPRRFRSAHHQAQRHSSS